MGASCFGQVVIDSMPTLHAERSHYTTPTDWANLLKYTKYTNVTTGKGCFHTSSGHGIRNSKNAKRPPSRVVLIGDAAHTAVLGGGTAALSDGIDLAHFLSKARNTADEAESVESCLEAFASQKF